MARTRNLATVLNYRQLRLDLARMELAVAQRRLSHLRQRIDCLAETEIHLIDRATNSLRELAWDRTLLRGAQSYLGHVTSARRQAEAVAAELEGEVETKRNQVIAEQQGHRVMERLLHRFRAEEDQAARQAEAKTNEEASVLRATRAKWND